METELLGLAMARRLSVEPPVLSLFFIFNLVSFLIVGVAGVIKFKSNNYSLARLSFCLAVAVCLVYQAPLVIFSQRVETSLRDPWAYALVVNGSALFLMAWAFLSRRVDFSGEASTYPEKTNEIYLFTITFAIALLWIYLSSVPWACTGIYALLFDPSYTLLARELGVKLIGTSFSTYSLGAYAGAVAPMLILLSIWRVENSILHKKFGHALVGALCGFVAVAALLVSGTKGLLMPAALMLTAGAYFYRRTWHSRLVALIAATLFLIFSLFTFQLLRERGLVSGGRYDFAACSVKMGACQKSFSLLESMKGREDSLGLPSAQIAPIQSRLACLCKGESEAACPSVEIEYAIQSSASEPDTGGGSGLADRFKAYIGATAYRIFVVPLQVSIWHFMYGETESVEGVKTLPFANRVLGNSLNMPELVYQKYGVIYSQGDKTNTSTAPTSFLLAYPAYLGFGGFFIALGCILGLDLVLAMLARFIGASLMPVLIGAVMILSANFLVSDFITVLLSHGGIPGMLVLLIYSFLLKKKT